MRFYRLYRAARPDLRPERIARYHGPGAGRKTCKKTELAKNKAAKKQDLQKTRERAAQFSERGGLSLWTAASRRRLTALLGRRNSHSAAQHCAIGMRINTRRRRDTTIPRELREREVRRHIAYDQGRSIHRENNGPDLLGRWGAGTEIGTALFWDRAIVVYQDRRAAHFTVALFPP